MEGETPLESLYLGVVGRLRSDHHLVSYIGRNGIMCYVIPARQVGHLWLCENGIDKVEQ